MAKGLRTLMRRARRQFSNQSNLTRRFNRLGPRLGVEELEERIAPTILAPGEYVPYDTGSGVAVLYNASAAGKNVDITITDGGGAGVADQLDIDCTVAGAVVLQVTHDLAGGITDAADTAVSLTFEVGKDLSDIGTLWAAGDANHIQHGDGDPGNHASVDGTGGAFTGDIVLNNTTGTDSAITALDFGSDFGTGSLTGVVTVTGDVGTVDSDGAIGGGAWTVGGQLTGDWNIDSLAAASDITADGGMAADVTFTVTNDMDGDLIADNDDLAGELVVGGDLDGDILANNGNDIAANITVTGGLTANCLITADNDLSGDISAASTHANATISTATGVISGSISVSGTIAGAITADNGLSGDIDAGTISGTITVTDNDLSGDITTDTGAIGAINVDTNGNGDLLGNISSADNIGNIAVGGDIGTTSSANTISSAGTIGTIDVDGVLYGVITAATDIGNTTIVDGISSTGQIVVTTGNMTGTIGITDGGLAGLIKATNGNLAGNITITDGGIASTGQIIAGTGSSGNITANIDIVDDDMGGLIRAQTAITGDITIDENLAVGGVIEALGTSGVDALAGAITATNGSILGNILATQGNITGDISAAADITGLVRTITGDLTGSVTTTAGDITNLLIGGQITSSAGAQTIQADGGGSLTVIAGSILATGGNALNMTADGSLTVTVNGLTTGTIATGDAAGSDLTLTADDDGDGGTTPDDATNGDVLVVSSTDAWTEGTNGEIDLVGYDITVSSTGNMEFTDMTAANDVLSVTAGGVGSTLKFNSITATAGDVVSVVANGLMTAGTIDAVAGDVTSVTTTGALNIVTKIEAANDIGMIHSDGAMTATLIAATAGDITEVAGDGITLTKIEAPSGKIALVDASGADGEGTLSGGGTIEAGAATAASAMLTVIDYDGSDTVKYTIESDATAAQATFDIVFTEGANNKASVEVNILAGAGYDVMLKSVDNGDGSPVDTEFDLDDLTFNVATTSKVLGTVLVEGDTLDVLNWNGADVDALVVQDNVDDLVIVDSIDLLAAARFNGTAGTAALADSFTSSLTGDPTASPADGTFAIPLDPANSVFVFAANATATEFESGSMFGIEFTAATDADAEVTFTAGGLTGVGGTGDVDGLNLTGDLTADTDLTGFEGDISLTGSVNEGVTLTLGDAGAVNVTGDVDGTVTGTDVESFGLDGDVGATGSVTLNDVSGAAGVSVTGDVNGPIAVNDITNAAGDLAVEGTVNAALTFNDIADDLLLGDSGAVAPFDDVVNEAITGNSVGDDFNIYGNLNADVTLTDDVGGTFFVAGDINAIGGTVTLVDVDIFDVNGDVNDPVNLNDIANGVDIEGTITAAFTFNDVLDGGFIVGDGVTAVTVTGAISGQDIDDDGFRINGNLDAAVSLRAIGGGDDFDVTGNLMDEADVDLTGTLAGQFDIGGDVIAGATVNTAQIGSLDVDGDVAGPITTGAVLSGSFNVDGDLNAAVTVSGSINSAGADFKVGGAVGDNAPITVTSTINDQFNVDGGGVGSDSPISLRNVGSVNIDGALGSPLDVDAVTTGNFDVQSSVNGRIDIDGNLAGNVNTGAVNEPIDIVGNIAGSMTVGHVANTVDVTGNIGSGLTTGNINADVTVDGNITAGGVTVAHIGNTADSTVVIGDVNGGASVGSIGDNSKLELGSSDTGATIVGDVNITDDMDGVLVLHGENPNTDINIGGEMDSAVLVYGDAGDVTAEEDIGAAESVVAATGHLSGVISTTGDVNASIFTGGDGDGAMLISAATAGKAVNGEISVGMRDGVGSLTVNSGSDIDQVAFSSGGAAIRAAAGNFSTAGQADAFDRIILNANAGNLTVQSLGGADGANAGEILIGNDYGCTINIDDSVTAAGNPNDVMGVIVVSDDSDVSGLLDDTSIFTAMAAGLTDAAEVAEAALFGTALTDLGSSAVEGVFGNDGGGIDLSGDINAANVDGLIVSGDVDDIDMSILDTMGYIVSLYGSVNAEVHAGEAIGSIVASECIGGWFISEGTLAVEDDITGAGGLFDVLDDLGLTGVPGWFDGGILAEVGNIGAYGDAAQFAAAGPGGNYGAGEPAGDAMGVIYVPVGDIYAAINCNGNFGGIHAVAGGGSVSLTVPANNYIGRLVAPNATIGGSYNADNVEVMALSGAFILVAGQTQNFGNMEIELIGTADTLAIVDYDAGETSFDSIIVMGLSEDAELVVDGDVEDLIVDGDWDGLVDVAGAELDDSDGFIGSIVVSGDVSATAGLVADNFGDLIVEGENAQKIEGTLSGRDGVEWTNLAGADQTLFLNGGRHVTAEWTRVFGKVTEVELSGRGRASLLSVNADLDADDAAELRALKKIERQVLSGRGSDYVSGEGSANVGEVTVAGYNNQLALNSVLVDGDLNSLEVSSNKAMRSLWVSGGAGNVTVARAINRAFIGDDVENFTTGVARRVTIDGDVGTMAVAKAVKVDVRGTTDVLHVAGNVINSRFLGEVGTADIDGKIRRSTINGQVVVDGWLVQNFYGYD